jgi:hypothetical protein
MILLMMFCLYMLYFRNLQKCKIDPKKKRIYDYIKVNVPSLGLYNVLSLLVHYKHPFLAFKKIPRKMLVLVYNVHRRRKKL